MNIEQLLEKDENELTIEEQIFIQNHVIECIANKLEEFCELVSQQNSAIVTLNDRLSKLENQNRESFGTNMAPDRNVSTSGIITSLY